MYQVRHDQDERWVVLDLDDEPIFTGTRRQCEDWLDRQENTARRERAPRRSGWLRGVWSRFVSSFRKGRRTEANDTGGRASARSDVSAR